MPELRGQRVAFFLGLHAVRMMKEAVVDQGGHIACLAFTPDVVPLYNWGGFRTTDALQRVQLAGTGDSGAATAAPRIVDVPHVGFGRHLSSDALWTFADSAHDHAGVHLVGEPERNDWAAVVDYDGSVFPARREAFLHLWLANAHAAVQWREHDGRVRGYGCVRKVDVGYRVGPLFADDADIATALLQALLARVPTGQPVTVDMPERNTGAALRLGGAIVSRYDYLLAGTPAAPSFLRVFGVTTTEAG